MKNILILVFAICFAHQALAAAPAPSKCPDINVIKNVFVNAKMVEMDEGKYIVAQIGDYATSTIWGFGIGDIPAANEMEALAKAKQAIPTLGGAPTPFYIAESDVWACGYTVGYDYQAFAFTLPGTDNKSQNAKSMIKFPAYR